MPAAENMVDDGLTVDCHRQGAAHARVVEERLVEVEAIEIGAEIGIDAEEGGSGLAIGIDLSRRHRLGQVKLAGAKGAFLGIEAIDWIEMDGVEADRRCVPIRAGFFDNDHLIALPGFEDERPVADKTTGTRPWVSWPIDGAVTRQVRHRDRQPGWMTEQ